METAKITSKGQITIPKRVRAKLAVKPGDQLAFEFDGHGHLRITPMRRPPPPLRRFLAEEACTRRLDCKQIDAAIRQRMQRKYGSP